MNDVFSLIEKDQLMAPAGHLLSYAKERGVLNLHYGALPERILETLLESISISSASSTLNHYAEPKGNLELRALICEHYFARYGVKVNPDHEILVTNGSTEALALSILSTSNINDKIAITDPTYLIFAKTINSLGRQSMSFKRDAGQNEYADMNWDNLRHASAFVLNSPENPTGYVLSNLDWQKIQDVIQNQHTYLIHDELMGLLDYDGNHKPAICMTQLKEKILLVGGMSKSFAAPGLRLGWLIASKDMINKAHAYQRNLYLGVNPLSERIAKNILKDVDICSFIDGITAELRVRRNLIEQTLSKHGAYQCSRRVQGGLSMVLEVSKLFAELPLSYWHAEQSIGTCVARYLFDVAKVSVVPGVIYGDLLSNYIKLAICHEEHLFQEGVRRLVSI